jgi:hypothetical protein
MPKCETIFLNSVDTLVFICEVCKVPISKRKFTNNVNKFPREKGLRGVPAYCIQKELIYIADSQLQIFNGIVDGCATGLSIKRAACRRCA